MQARKQRRWQPETNLVSTQPTNNEAMPTKIRTISLSGSDSRTSSTVIRSPSDGLSTNSESSMPEIKVPRIKVADSIPEFKDPASPKVAPSLTTTTTPTVASSRAPSSSTTTSSSSSSRKSSRASSVASSQRSSQRGLFSTSPTPAPRRPVTRLPSETKWEQCKRHTHQRWVDFIEQAKNVSEIIYLLLLRLTCFFIRKSAD